MNKLAPAILLVFAFAAAAFAQTPPPPVYQPQQGPPEYRGPVISAPHPDPVQNISNRMDTLNISVVSLSRILTEFVEKFAAVGSTSLSERQQKIVMAMELLVRAEERVAMLQKHHIDLTEKLDATRNRLAQVERDLRDESIDRGVAFQGTTRAEELRESRRRELNTERQSLNTQINTIQTAVNQTQRDHEEARLFADRLRRSVLPSIEDELSDL
ncbi:MAG: hypothetical protein H0V76_11630 [Blastocatellia bacterium]|nr:hypothetical protein [Blastocatellia bacterium]